MKAVALVLAAVLILLLLPRGADSGNRPLRVAVLDTGLDLKDPRFTAVLCPSGHYDATGTGLVDKHGHGTHVAGLIKRYAGNSSYCLIIVKYTDGKGTSDVATYVKGLNHIERIQPDVVNISGGDYQSIMREAEIVGHNLRMIFVAAAGNNHRPVIEFYPAALSLVLPNIMAIGADDYVNSNYGDGVVYEHGNKVYSTLPNGKYGYMTGTSMACAIHTGRLIYAKSH